MKNTIAAVLSICAGTVGAFGQCTFGISLWESFRETQAAAVGERQRVGNAFSFRRDGITGPLLAAVHNSESLPLSWGDSTQPFNVPQAGPISSADPLINQNPFHNREPGFTGIMLHPGYNSIRATAIFTAQTMVRVSSMTLLTEVLGDTSNGVQVVLKKVLADGTETVITGPITSSWGNGPVTTPFAPLVPVVLQAGDRIVVETSNNGAPEEDWENVELRMQLSNSPPVIIDAPRRVASCPGGSVTLDVDAAGATGYQWQKGTVDLVGETGSTLTLSGVDDGDSAQYRCVVSNTCGSNTSAYGSVLVRTADIGSAGGIEPGDGQLDNNDFIVFITRFFANDARADYGAAGGFPGPDDAFDNNDFIVFINLFFNGCG